MRIAATALVGSLLVGSCSSSGHGRSPTGFLIPGGLRATGFTLQREGHTVKIIRTSESLIFVAAAPGTYELLITCGPHSDLEPSIPVVVLSGEPKTAGVPACPP